MDDSRSVIATFSNIEACATEFVSKPIGTIDLRARAKNLLALRQSQVASESRAATLERAVAAATAEIGAREEEIIRLASGRASECGGGRITSVAL